MDTITQARTNILKLTVGLFNAAPGANYLSEFTSVFEANGHNLAALAGTLGTTGAFQSLYPNFQTASEFATKFLTTLGLQGNTEAVDFVTAKFNAGVPKAQIIYDAVVALDASTSAEFAAAKAILVNKAAVAENYCVTLVASSTSLETLQGALANVTADPASVTAANAANAGGNGQTFMLTASVDTATANVFNSRPEYTPGGNDLVNTLQDEDELTGYGDNPTLNVTLGSVNDSAEAFINPILNGIETINIAVTSGDIEGLGLEGATGTKAVNITRITQNQTDLEIENIAESADTLSVSNATRGASVEFNFRDDAGVSLEDELNVNLTNVRLNALDITRTGSLKDQHDTVNLTTSGPVAEVTAFSVFGDDVAATGQVLNLHANSLSSTFTTLTAGSVTDMNLHANGDTEITSLVAPALRNLGITANSDVDIVGQTTAALRTITIDGDSNVDLGAVQGDTASGLTIDSTELAASGRLMAVLNAVSSSSKTVVNTGAGDDVLTSTAHIAGTIDAGDGDNTITTAANFAATASVSAGHGDNTVSGLVMAAAGDTIAELKSTNAVDSAASITLGNGNNTVSVTDMQSAASWENWDTLDANVDDTYLMVGAQITAGNGDNTVNVSTMAENAVVDLGNGENTVNFSGFGATGATVMAADSTNDRERVDLSSADAEEDTLGAQVYLGNGGNTVNFNDTVWEGVGEDAGDVDAVLIGEGALLSAGTGADTLNVNFINDVDVVAHATEDFNEALIQGFEEINLTAQKAGLDGEDTLIENTASVILDVQRVDSELETINMVSLEDVTLVNTGLGNNQEREFYVAGNATYFTLENLREEVEVNLSAQEATGVNGEDELEDDHVADVFLAVDMVDASGENDTFTLNIANSGAFDLDLTVGTSSFPQGEDRDGKNAYETENVVINLNTNSHTFYFNDFGDGYENETSLTINGTAAGKEIVLNNVNANVITVNGAANVTLEMVDVFGEDYVDSAENAKLVQVTTGRGADHVHVNAFSLDVEGSFVDLGTGANTIGINGLVDVAEAGEDSAADALESFSELDLRGSMNRVELLDSFDIDRAVELDLSGFDTDVKELYIGDLYGSAGEDSQNDLTITGMSGDVLIQSNNYFVLDADVYGYDENDYFGRTDADYAGRLTVEGATSITLEAGVDHGSRSEEGTGTWSEVSAGSWVDGEFIIEDGFVESGEVEFNLGVGNATLTSLNVAAADDATVQISNNDDSVAFDIGQINIYSYVNDAELNFNANLGTVVTVGDINLDGGDDARLNLHDSEGAEYSFGVVTLTAAGIDVGEDGYTQFHFDEMDGEGHVGSSLEMVSFAATAASYAEFEINSTQDTTVTILGQENEGVRSAAISLDAGTYIEVNLGEDGDSNVGTTMTFGNIDLTAGEDLEMDVNYNISSTFTFGAIDAVAGEDVDIGFNDNLNSDITVDSLDLTSTANGAYLSFYGNELTDDEADVTDMLITVNGSISIQSYDESAYFDIYDNDDNSIERDLVIDIKGNVALRSTDDYAYMEVSNNDDATIHLREAVSITSEDDLNYSQLYMDENYESTIRFYNTVTVSATGEDSDAYVTVNDNDDASIRFDGLVSIVAGEDAYFDVNDNDDEASIRFLGGVDIEAGGLIDIDIEENDYALVSINGITAESMVGGSVNLYIYENDNAAVRTSNVSLTAAGGAAILDISDNDNSEVTLGILEMSGTTADLDIDSNGSSDINVGNISMIATVGSADFYVHESGEDDIDLGTVTIRAADDVYFYAANHGEDASVDVGNIDVRAGAVWNEVTAAWVDSTNDSAEVYLYLDNVGSVETIHLQTNAGEDSDIDAYINDTPDLHTVTLVGGGVNVMSELEIYGEQGNDEGVFTIDLSDLTSEAWVRTVTNDYGDYRDEVDYVADFASGTVVKVMIGSSSLVEYNVEDVNPDYLFAGSDSGYVSTGDRDLTPVLELLSIGGFEGTNSGPVEYNSWNSSDTITVNFGGSAFQFTNSENGVWTVSGPEGVNTFGGFIAAIGATYAGISAGNLIIEGAYDGSDIPAITSIIKDATTTYYVYDDEDFGGGYDTFTTSNTSIPSYSVTTNGVMVSDGKGLTEREIFTFTDDEIGDVVIGGFNPGAWNTVSPINGQITDRLDFSQFAGVDSLDDMIFSIVDVGPFDNVKIDFVDDDLGTITLVGVGEYEGAIGLVQGSILFA